MAYIKDVYIGAPVAVESCELTESAELSEDSYLRLEWDVFPSYAANKEVIFSSSDESVVKVSPKGRIYAVGAGTAEIILTTMDGGHTARCTVTVTPSDYTRLYGIDIENDSLLTFTNSDPGQPEVLLGDFKYTSAAAYYDGIVYGIALEDEYWSGYLYPHMWTYNIDTEEYIVGSRFCSSDYSPRHLAYDYANSKMYVLGYDNAVGRFSIYEVDLTSGAIIEDTRKEIGTGMLPTCFTIALDGTAYMISTSGTLYSFDPAADLIELTAIGNTGISTMNGQAYSQGLCFDHQSGTLYFSYVASQSDYGLCIVDVNSGEVERLGNFPIEVFQVCGLFTIYDEPEYVWGDSNGDGNVDMGDAVLILRHSMGVYTIPYEYLKYVDMNNDGVVNNADAVIVVRMCMGNLQ